jgi:hypothetical protein
VTQEKEKIDCFTCRHFYVTWDKKHPKGCRAMGFKSREMPSIAVFESSGMKCLRYKPKEISAQRKG